MAYDAKTERLISLKKLSGKAHTSNDKGLANEPLPSGITMSTTTIFADAITASPNSASPYTITGNVEFLRLPCSFKSGTNTVDGRHGFEIKLPADYVANSSNSKAGTGNFTNGKLLHETGGTLQLIPSSFATAYEAKPFYGTIGSGTQIPLLDDRDWNLDYFNGVLFQQDPPGTGDHAQNPTYIEAFLYIGDYLSESSGGSGDITAVVAGTGLSGGANSGSATLTVDFSEFSDVSPANGDKLATLDSDGSTEQLTTIASLATLFAGTASSTGLSASSSVLSVSDLHPVGVDGSANQLLTDDGDGTMTSEPKALVDGAKITIGNGTAEDSLLVFDGNAADFRIGIDDDSDALEIGAGAAHDTTAAIVIDSSGHVTKIGQDAPSSDQVLTWDGSKAVWSAASGGGGDAFRTISIGPAGKKVRFTNNFGMGSYGTVPSNIILRFSDGSANHDFTVDDNSGSSTASATTVGGGTDRSAADVVAEFVSEINAGSLNVTATAVAGNTSTDASFTVEPDSGSTVTVTEDPGNNNSGNFGDAAGFTLVTSISGQDDVVADSATDTLTLLGDTGINITTTASTDNIAISTAAAQSHVTSLGTLTSLGITGDLTVDTNTLHVKSSTNKVGIGTTSPDASLDVKATAHGDGIYVEDDGTTTKVVKLKADSAGGVIELRHVNNDQKVRLDASSSSWFDGVNVGFGTTSPSTNLEVKADSHGDGIYLEDDGTTTKVIKLKADSAGGVIELRHIDNNQKIRLDATGNSWLTSGNIGIGTESPAKKLDVTGDFKVSGTTTLNSIEYTWPASDGSSGQQLQTNGNGTLSWAAAGTVSGDSGGRDKDVYALSQTTALNNISIGSTDLSTVDYNPNSIDVFLNGMLLHSGSASDVAASNADYYLTGASTLKFAFAVEADDLLDVVVSEGGSPSSAAYITFEAHNVLSNERVFRVSEFLSLTTTESGFIDLDINRKKITQVMASDLTAGNVLASGYDFSKVSYSSDRIDVFVNGVLLLSGSSHDYYLQPTSNIIFGFNLFIDDHVTINII